MPTTLSDISINIKVNQWRWGRCWIWWINLLHCQSFCESSFTHKKKL